MKLNLDARTQYNNLGRILACIRFDFMVFLRVTPHHTCDFRARRAALARCYTAPMRAFIATLCLALFSISLSAADISGTWSAAVTLDAGSGNATFVFKQSGENLTGTYTGVVGSANLTGTVKGSDVEWSFEADQVGKVSYKGKLDASGKITGTVEYGQLGSGKFTAEKQK